MTYSHCFPGSRHSSLPMSLYLLSMIMRREGLKFAIRSSHTLRSNPCVSSRRQMGFSEAYCCHSRYLHEDAYQYLSVARGDWVTDEKEVWKQVQQWEGTRGPRRTRWQACALGTAARKSRVRLWSWDRENRISNRSRKDALRRDIVDALMCCT